MFSRGVKLPYPVCEVKVTAEYRDGLLVVTLPKTSAHGGLRMRRHTEELTMNIQQYLKDKNVFFTVHLHPDTFDSQHLAEQLHEPGKNVVKTVLLHANHGFVYVVAVLPATHHVDLERLSTVLGHNELHLATIDEITRCCPDCECGVLPPFGSKFGMKTIVDEAVAQAEFLVMQGNTRDEAIRMTFTDYYNLERPLMASFAVHD